MIWFVIMVGCYLGLIFLAGVKVGMDIKEAEYKKGGSA